MPRGWRLRMCSIAAGAFYQEGLKWILITCRMACFGRRMGKSMKNFHQAMNWHSISEREKITRVFHALDIRFFQVFTKCTYYFIIPGAIVCFFFFNSQNFQVNMVGYSCVISTPLKQHELHHHWLLKMINPPTEGHVVLEDRRRRADS